MLKAKTNKKTPKYKQTKTNSIVTFDHLKSRRRFTQPKPRRRQETGEERVELKSVLP